jgi:MYXO-CTERM domain-containing protein
MAPSIARFHATIGGMLLALFGASVAVAQSAPAYAATITFNLFSNSPEAIVPLGITDPIFGEGAPSSIFHADYIGPSLLFEKGGVKLTIANPSWASGSSVSRSNQTLGTCLGGDRPNSIVVCGNEGTNPSPQIASIKLKFDKSVKLISTSGILRSFFAEIGATDPQVTSTWTSQALTSDFTYRNTIPASPSAIKFTNPYTSTFNDDFIVSADIEIVVSSNFAGNVDYWAQTLKVEPVPAPAPAPGPLPLFGAAAAFGWSRRIRKQIK